MSLVGPRPHATQHNEFYRKVITGYMQRHSNLPGMTGLAQIEGERGETNTIKEMKRRIQYDMEYNNDWNLLNDFNFDKNNFSGYKRRCLLVLLNHFLNFYIKRQKLIFLISIYSYKFYFHLNIHNHIYNYHIHMKPNDLFSLN